MDRVSSTAPDLESTRTYRPFFAFRHDAERSAEETFWHTSRRPSERKDDEGTEVYLSLVDMAFDPSVPDTETLNVHLTCSNRDLPGQSAVRKPRGGLPARRTGRLHGNPRTRQADAEPSAAAPARLPVAAHLAPLPEHPLARRARGSEGTGGAPGDPPALRLRRLVGHPSANRRALEALRPGASSVPSGTRTRGSSAGSR